MLDNGPSVPFYEYRRPDGTTIEVMHKMTDPPLTEDPDTGVPLQRVFRPIAVHFKGKGFYNTDYGTKNRARETAEFEGANKRDASKAGDSKDGDSKDGDSKASDSKASESKAGDSKAGESASGDAGASSAKAEPAAKAPASESRAPKTD